MSAVIVKYLDGWQKYEARIDDQSAAAAVVDTSTAATTTSTPEPVSEQPTPQPASEDSTPEPDVPPASNLAFINPPTAPAPPATSAGTDADLVGVPDEPDAPLPGAIDEPVDPEPGDELGDIPDPPTDEEIAAVEYELSQGLPPARAA